MGNQEGRPRRDREPASDGSDLEEAKHGGGREDRRRRGRFTSQHATEVAAAEGVSSGRGQRSSKVTEYELYEQWKRRELQSARASRGDLYGDADERRAERHKRRQRRERRRMKRQATGVRHPSDSDSETDEMQYDDGARTRNYRADDTHERKDERRKERDRNAPSEAEEDDEEAREERRRKNLRAERLAILADEFDVPQYVDDFPNSHEKQVAVWGIVKVVAFFIFMAAAFFIYQKDYDKRVCFKPTLRSGTARYCVDFRQLTDVLESRPDGEPRLQCVGVDTAACSVACTTLGDAAEGCVETSNDVFECYPRVEIEDELFENGTVEDEGQASFRDTCEDLSTCSTTNPDNMLSVMLLMGLILVLLMALEVLQTVGLIVYSSYAEEDFLGFEGWSTAQQLMLFGTKSAPGATQFVYVVLVVAQSYLAVITYATTDLCSNGVTTTGAPFTLLDDVTFFCIFNSVMVVAVLVIGSVVRHRLDLRGQLFRPSNDAAIRCRPWLDCGECRYRARPRCCPDAFDGCYNCLPKGARPLSTCCAHTVDLCCTPCLKLGALNAWFCRHRHFIGP